MVILNGVTSENSFNYLWYVCVFEKYLWIIGSLIFIFILNNIRTEKKCLVALNIMLGLIYLTQTVHHFGKNVSCTERSDLGGFL